MKNLLKFILILLSISLVTFCVFQFVKKAPEEASLQAVEPAERVKLSQSQVARNSIIEVLDGKRKVPQSSDASAMRYYKLRQEWVDALDLSDCIALIDKSEGTQLEGEFREKLYIQYGRLDHQSALQRVEKMVFKDKTMKILLISNITEGWGSVYPEEAWQFFDEKIKSGALLDMKFDRVSQVIFEAWARKNSEEAYQNLMKTKGEYLWSGAIGFYWGLPDTVNFPEEAIRLEEAISAHKFLSGSHWLMNSGREWNSQETLAADFASKWANKDMDAAIQWWLKLDDTKVEDKDIDKRRVYRIGLLFYAWMGYFEEKNPDRIIKWIYANLENLQYSEFRNLVLPLLVIYRPHESLDIVKKIQPVRLQALVLSGLIQSTEHLNREERFNRRGSTILFTDLAEKALATLNYDNEASQWVRDAISKRREFERTKPQPAPSDW
jgi:hypothetical protein